MNNNNTATQAQGAEQPEKNEVSPMMQAFLDAKKPKDKTKIKTELVNTFLTNNK